MQFTFPQSVDKTTSTLRQSIAKVASGPAFHISNRHMNLPPVLQALAQDLGLTYLEQEDDFHRPPGIPQWHRAGMPAPSEVGSAAIWADGYSSIVSIIDWQ